MTTTAIAIGSPSNDAKETISFEQPYIVKMSIEGVAPFLFHRWSVEGVEAKANAAKGSKAKKQDDIDRRRVMVQRNGVTRQRPAMQTGWKIEVPLMCNTPEYIQPAFLNEVSQLAGRLIGLGDFRPTFGRFVVTKFDLV